MPKTPEELSDQVEQRNEDRPADDHFMTSEVKIPNLTRATFSGTLPGCPIDTDDES